jgi:hypothetical protein
MPCRHQVDDMIYNMQYNQTYLKNGLHEISFFNEEGRLISTLYNQNRPDGPKLQRARKVPRV